MPETVTKQIMDSIGTRLAYISTTNGYTFTAKSIDRARRRPWKRGDLPAINYWSDEDRQLNVGAGFVQRELAVMVEAHTTTRDEPFTDVAAEMAGDITTCLFRSSSSQSVTDAASPALGGLVSSVTIQSILPAIGEGQSPFCGVLIQLAIRYNVAINDPYVAIN